MTLASCTVKQTSSQLDDRKSISLFTYWLNEGLKGYADDSGDGTVDTGELINYVAENIAWREKAKHFKELKQTDDEKKDDDAEKKNQEGQWATVVTTKETPHVNLAAPKPRNLQQTLDDFADQIVTRLLTLDIKELKLNHFASDTGKEPLARKGVDDLLSAGKYSTDELKRLIEHKGDAVGGITVTAPDETAAALRNITATLHNKIAVDSLNGKEAFLLSSRLAIADLPDADSVISTKVRTDRTGETIESPKPEPENVPLTYPTGAAAEVDAFEVPDVRIEVQMPNGAFVPRKIIEIDGSQWVPLNDGEVYRIAFTLNSLPVEGVGLKLLVDGRNILPQYLPYAESKYAIVGPAPTSSQDEGQTSEPASEPASSPASDPASSPVAEPVIAPAVRLDNAQFWILNELGRPYYFKGFYHNLGLDAVYDEFTVAKTADHLQPGEFNDQIGLITVAFYGLCRSRATPNDVMTVPGKRHPQPIFMLNGLETGSQLGCVRLRYASSAALADYLRQSVAGTPAYP